MRGGYLAAVLLVVAQAFAGVTPACAEEPVASPEPSGGPAAPPSAPGQPEPSAATVNQLSPAAGSSLSSPDPVVAIIRAKLADPSLRNGANAADLAALEAFYRRRTGAPLWMTDMGFSAKGQHALFAIEKADDWGLDASAFELPPPDDLPASPEAEAIAEIKLDLAVLKYARFARGGRVNPSEVSGLFDQAPHLRDANMVLAEIAAADATDAYLQSLHPKHEQFVRLRQALLRAREGGGPSSQPARVEIERIIMNMERWRWMPEDLGNLYVWSNTPEFMLYVIKDGKTIYADKTQVGTIGNATPVFSSDMATIVFNPDWIAPPTVLVADLLPSLRRKNYALLEKHKFLVSYHGEPVNAAMVDWGRVNIRDYIFTQKAGPDNRLGKVKFLFPNKYDVYMHDTTPDRRKVFQKPMRAIGYGCVRMEKPDRFAELLLAEANGWPASKVKDLWDNGVNSSVTADHRIPVHLTYFTAVVDGTGKVATFADLYGLDNKLATALFGDAKGFPMPPPEPKRLQGQEAGVSASAKQTVGGNALAASLQGVLGD
jgi:L,D-transpeptidase YcbB